jgi:hypothetical protein
MSYFPTPADHARILIDVCGGIAEARDAAEFNRETASDDEQSLYWLAVRNALTPEEPCRAS